MKRVALILCALLVGAPLMGQMATSPATMAPTGPDIGLPKLTDAEIATLRNLANNKDVKAAYRLYQDFYFAQKDDLGGTYWLRVSAFNGYPLAEYTLAKKLSQSDSPLDREESQSWFAKAEQHGFKPDAK